MIKCVSFDLQGTITESDFCDSLWINIIPRIYALRKNISEQEAKIEIKNIYGENAIYNLKYYDDNYWTKMLEFNAIEELEKIGKKPKIDGQFIEIIKNLKTKKIIISTTTNLFINTELGKEAQYFDKLYSCVDYFKIGGKTPEVFIKVAKELNLKPQEILHIGDNYIMDIENAKKAGVNTIHFNGNTDETINKIKEYLEGKVNV